MTINDVRGSQSVDIHEPSILPALAAKEGKGGKTARAIGYGNSLQDAVDNAIVQLPAHVPDSADILFRYNVREQGKLVGGFAGFDIYFAEVERNP